MNPYLTLLREHAASWTEMPELQWAADELVSLNKRLTDCTEACELKNRELEQLHRKCSALAFLLYGSSHNQVTRIACPSCDHVWDLARSLPPAVELSENPYVVTEYQRGFDDGLRSATSALKSEMNLHGGGFED